MIPPIAYLSYILLVLLTVDIRFISNVTIRVIKRRLPNKPKLEAKTPNIKSVCSSGKYIGV